MLNIFFGLRKKNVYQLFLPMFLAIECGLEASPGSPSVGSAATIETTVSTKKSQKKGGIASPPWPVP
jgi:hypothetical protein